jgi:diaminopimelate decarboxylase
MENICSTSSLAAQVGAAFAPENPGLAPRLGTVARKLLAAPETAHRLVRSLGSPLNLIFPTEVIRNAASLQETFEHYGIDGRIFFTTKPNRSTAILREVAATDLGVDVSSCGSLSAALSAGIPSHRLEATGPKDETYLSLALLHDIVVNVDSLTELEDIRSLRRSLGIRSASRILIRLSGFAPQRSLAVSDGTFGVTPTDIPALWNRLDAMKNEIELLGFAFHLNTDSIEYRAVALEESLHLLFEARRHGHNPRIVNLGGGFRVRYAEDTAEWARFLLALKDSLRSNGPLHTWNRSGLGFHVDGATIKGQPRFMNHAEELPPADQLCSLLKSPLPRFNGITAGRLLSESLVEVWIEPGRALLDQAGLTLATVTTVRSSERGEPLLRLAMNRSNLNAHELTLLTDPIALPTSAERQQQPRGYFLVGNLCVANELLSPRKVYFSTPIESGDILAFINTAAYMMDFAESSTLHQPVARKVAVTERADVFDWALDPEYRPHAWRLR